VEVEVEVEVVEEEAEVAVLGAVAEVAWESLWAFRHQAVLHSPS
jgi:hypothetical protein